MGLMDTIFGSPGGVSGKAKKAAWNVYGQYGNMGNGGWYNPQTDQAQAMEQFDRQRMVGQAAGYGKIAGSGYRPSGGVDYMALARAMYGSGVGQKARQQALDWRLRGLQGQAGLLPTIIGANTTQPTSGLLGGLAGLASGGLGGLFGGSGEIKKDGYSYGQSTGAVYGPPPNLGGYQGPKPLSYY